jgi:hypothetical protein
MQEKEKASKLCRQSGGVPYGDDCVCKGYGGTGCPQGFECTEFIYDEVILGICKKSAPTGDIGMTQELCESSGGWWNSGAAMCECGGESLRKCPDGYVCYSQPLPEGVVDGNGVCRAAN